MASTHLTPKNFQTILDIFENKKIKYRTDHCNIFAFEEFNTLLNTLLQKEKEQLLQWLKEPGLHFFISTPSQTEARDIFFNEQNLTDKIIFKCGPYWNTHYNSPNHALELIIVEQT